MKKIYLLFLVFCLSKTYAQRVTGYNNNNGNNSTYNNGNRVSNAPKLVGRASSDELPDQIRIVDTTQEIRAEVLPYKSEPKIKNDRYYFWYLNNAIRSTQGGYTGQLLNGHYTAFYPDKNLKEDGNFKRGLKDGEWKTWNKKGDLLNVTNWNEGVQASDNQTPIWKRLPFMKKDEPQGTKQGSN